jgi:hypothetical protein
VNAFSCAGVLAVIDKLIVISSAKIKLQILMGVVMSASLVGSVLKRQGNLQNKKSLLICIPRATPLCPSGNP